VNLLGQCRHRPTAGGATTTRGGGAAADADHPRGREATAEGRWLPTDKCAVIGTHTHIQTNDARVTPSGTAAVTDAGMTGPHDSVIGVVTDLAVKQMRTGMPVRFKTAQGDVRLEGCLIECDDDGRATRCELVRRALETGDEPVRSMCL
jgi:calcineurin-like phosphoesterase